MPGNAEFKMLLFYIPMDMSLSGCYWVQDVNIFESAVNISWEGNLFRADCIEYHHTLNRTSEPKVEPLPD